jgi:hypothetical protein
MFTQLLAQPPIALNKAKPGLEFAGAIERVVMKGLSRAPAERYTDVTAFSQALCEALRAPAEPTTPAEEEAGGLLSRVKGLFRR